MKVAFDENVPIKVVRLFQALTSRDSLLPQFEFVCARDYTGGAPQEDDVPWLEAFASDGGQVVISGDGRMRGKPHERKAYRDAGLIVFFFGSRWCNMTLFPRSALLLNWWPAIERQLEVSSPRQCWEIPASWSHKPMRDVTGPDNI